MCIVAFATCLLCALGFVLFAGTRWEGVYKGDQKTTTKESNPIRFESKNTIHQNAKPRTTDTLDRSKFNERVQSDFKQDSRFGSYDLNKKREDVPDSKGQQIASTRRRGSSFAVDTWKYVRDIEAGKEEASSLVGKAVKYDKMLRSILENIVDQIATPVNDYLVQIVIDLRGEEKSEIVSEHFVRGGERSATSNVARIAENTRESYLLEKIVDLEDSVRVYVRNVFEENSELRKQQRSWHYRDSVGGSVHAKSEERLKEIQEDVYVDGLLELMLSPETDFKCCCRGPDGRNDCLNLGTTPEEWDTDGFPTSADPGPPEMEFQAKLHPLLRSCWIERNDLWGKTRPRSKDEREEGFDREWGKKYLHLLLFVTKIRQQQQQQQQQTSKVYNQNGGHYNANCSIVLMFSKVPYDKP